MMAPTSVGIPSKLSQALPEGSPQAAEPERVASPRYRDAGSGSEEPSSTPNIHIRDQD